MTDMILNKEKKARADVIQRLAAFGALILLIVGFAIASPYFFTFDNIVGILIATAVNGFLAIGVTFIIITGGIDLSVGTVMTLSSVVAAVFVAKWELPVSLGIAAAILTGTLAGLLNGVMVSRMKLPPFIATLGMLYIARGFAGLRNNGYTFSNLIGKFEFGNKGFERLGAGNFLGISYSIWIMVIFALVAFFVMTRLPFGRHVFALGGNRRAAELSGVRTNRTATIVYMISGFCSAMVGLIIASQLVAAHPATGTGFELTAIAAVVLGGTSLSGGRGSIGGTIIGAFVIGVLSDGLVILGFSTFLQNIIKGIVIVVAVVIDQIQISMQERIALQRQELK